MLSRQRARSSRFQIFLDWYSTPVLTSLVISVLPLAEFHPTRKAKRAPAHDFRRASPSSPNLELSFPFIALSEPFFNSCVFNCLPTLAKQGFQSTLFLSTSCALLRRNSGGGVVWEFLAKVLSLPSSSLLITRHAFAPSGVEGALTPFLATHPK